eukprot:7382833-Pyramimonas_sp.AAC.1
MSLTLSDDIQLLCLCHRGKSVDVCGAQLVQALRFGCRRRPQRIVEHIHVNWVQVPHQCTSPGALQLLDRVLPLVHG